MTAVVEVAERGVDASLVVLERLEFNASELLAGALNRPVQMTNGSVYLQGLIERDSRKSLEP